MSSEEQNHFARLLTAVREAVRRAQARATAESARAKPGPSAEVKIMSTAERQAARAQKRAQSERRALEWAREQQAGRQTSENPLLPPTPSDRAQGETDI